MVIPQDKMIRSQFQINVNKGKFPMKRNKRKYSRFKNNNTTVCFFNEARLFDHYSLFTCLCISPSAEPVIFIKQKISRRFAIGHRKRDQWLSRFMKCEELVKVKVRQDINIAGDKSLILLKK